MDNFKSGVPMLYRSRKAFAFTVLVGSFGWTVFSWNDTIAGWFMNPRPTDNLNVRTCCEGGVQRRKCSVCGIPRLLNCNSYVLDLLACIVPVHAAVFPLDVRGLNWTGSTFRPLSFALTARRVRNDMRFGSPRVRRGEPSMLAHGHFETALVL